MRRDLWIPNRKARGCVDAREDRLYLDKGSGQTVCKHRRVALRLSLRRSNLVKAYSAIIVSGGSDG